MSGYGQGYGGKFQAAEFSEAGTIVSSSVAIAAVTPRDVPNGNSRISIGTFFFKTAATAGAIAGWRDVGGGSEVTYFSLAQNEEITISSAKIFENKNREFFIKANDATAGPTDWYIDGHQHEL